MPRARRYFLPGHVWHITHRCHQQEFFLKFARIPKGTFLIILHLAALDKMEPEGRCVLFFYLETSAGRGGALRNFSNM